MPLNIEIGFAYTSFKWRNNAKNSAGVTCIIVGIENVCKRKKLLFHDETFLQCDYISPALSIESENIIVEKRSKPISNLPKMILGSLPADGGFLIFKESEYNYIIEKYPASIRLFKQFLGSGEIIKGIVRYCLWITDDLIELAYSIPELCQRFKSVSKYRSRSTKKNTQEFAQLPYKFTENRYCSKDAIAIPITSSENREYIPICLTFNKDVVIYHSACAVYNFELWLFSVLTSKMHNLWVREVGGALETRIRYSATLCYNTYPFPDISELQKTELANLAQEALDIRDQHFDMTLGEMYNSKTMPKDLKEIHHRIDIAVERCYRIEPFNSDKERLECLFKLYAKMKKK